MARVTVEDCLLKVPNKFELVLLAAKRAKDIEAGATPAIARDNDKPSIIALREIADDVISIDGLRKISKKSIIEDADTIHTFERRDSMKSTSFEYFHKDEMDADDSNEENKEINEG